LKGKPSLIEFLSPEHSIIRYVVGTAALTVAIQFVYDQLTLGFGAAGAGALIAALLILALLMFWWDYRRRHIQKSTPRFQPIQPRQGLVILVSSGNEEVPLKLVEHHAVALSQVWLISSKESLMTADRLVEAIHERWPGVVVHPTADYVVDAESPRSAWDVVKRIFDESELASANLVVDITGGTKLMSIGASLACSEPGRDMEYLVTPRRPQDGDVDTGAVGIPIQISTDWALERSGD
jgi:hypothetical protein